MTIDELAHELAGEAECLLSKPDKDDLRVIVDAIGAIYRKLEVMTQD